MHQIETNQNYHRKWIKNSIPYSSKNQRLSSIRSIDSNSHDSNLEENMIQFHSNSFEISVDLYFPIWNRYLVIQKM